MGLLSVSEFCIVYPLLMVYPASIEFKKKNFRFDSISHDSFFVTPFSKVSDNKCNVKVGR